MTEMKKITHSILVWVATSFYDGQPDKLAAFFAQSGLKACPFKFGNGKWVWSGLEKLPAALKKVGVEAWGWWFCTGEEKDEGEKIGLAADMLGLDVVVLDVEAAWDSRSGVTDRGRQETARRLVKGIRKHFSGKIALCSWWKPSAHTTPVKVFFDEGCSINMPQTYWMGRFSESSAANLIGESLDEYSRLAGVVPSQTIPVLAAFGQTVVIYQGSEKKEVWWKSSLPQMKAAYKEVIRFGCKAASWWSLDYLFGLNGHEIPKRPEPGMLDYILSTVGTGQVVPEPEPEPPPIPPDLVPFEIHYPSSRAQIILHNTEG